MSSTHPLDPANFVSRIEKAYIHLSSIPEDQTIRPLRPGGWTAKHTLGHLIDSAVNNRLRFVRGALDKSFDGPTYDQNGWVNLHGYAEMSWSELVATWHAHNRMLVRVVQRMPTEAAHYPCRIQGSEMSLGFVVADYLTHLEHHVAQILGSETATQAG